MSQSEIKLDIVTDSSQSLLEKRLNSFIPFFFIYVIIIFCDNMASQILILIYCENKLKYVIFLSTALTLGAFYSICSAIYGKWKSILCFRVLSFHMSDEGIFYIVYSNFYVALVNIIVITHVETQIIGYIIYAGIAFCIILSIVAYLHLTSNYGLGKPPTHALCLSRLLDFYFNNIHDFSQIYQQIGRNYHGYCIDFQLIKIKPEILELECQNLEIPQEAKVFIQNYIAYRKPFVMMKAPDGEFVKELTRIDVKAKEETSSEAKPLPEPDG